MKKTKSKNAKRNLGHKRQRNDEAFYNQETEKYHYRGSIYNEGDLIWSEFISPPGSIFEIRNNLIAFEPFVVGRFAVDDGVILEANSLYNFYQQAQDLAMSKDNPGTIKICSNGKFRVPSYSFYNKYTDECDYLVNIFNIIGCQSDHRNLFGTIISQVGSLTLETYFRFCRGQEIDWFLRFTNELAWIRQDYPRFNPFKDPYADPKNPIAYPPEDLLME